MSFHVDKYNYTVTKLNPANFISYTKFLPLTYKRQTMKAAVLLYENLIDECRLNISVFRQALKKDKAERRHYKKLIRQQKKLIYESRKTLYNLKRLK